MIKYLVILVAALGIGYTYGYLHGAAGEDDLVAVALHTVGIRRAAKDLGRSVDGVRDEEARRQAVIDSVKQARHDSIASLVHH
jgi:hypothetical protein